MSTRGSARRSLIISLVIVGAGALGSAMLLASSAFASHPEPDLDDCDRSVRFGIDAGSPFPPPAQHDASGHAADSLVPRTVVVSEGDVVCFGTSGVHQFAAYKPGTQPGDIDVTVTTGAPMCPPVPLIDDEDGRIDFQVHRCSEARTYGFDTEDLDAGRYLVICTFLPHFTEGDMYGWVIVR